MAKKSRSRKVEAEPEDLDDDIDIDDDDIDDDDPDDDDGEDDPDEEEEATAAEPKRKPGRPPGSKNKSGGKSAVAAKPKPKKKGKRGRPKKSQPVIDEEDLVRDDSGGDTEPSAPKRKPGRPPGSGAGRKRKAKKFSARDIYSHFKEMGEDDKDEMYASQVAGIIAGLIVENMD